MYKLTRWSVLGIIGAAALGAARGAPAAAPSADDHDVTLRSLLEEMTDRERLARWPSPEYRCAQFSSYDRASTSPDDKATWYANIDHSHFLRAEAHAGRTEYVMMDAPGPGAVVRFWSTWHASGDRAFGNGTLRVYLDGDETPAIEGPIADLLDGGALVGPPLAQGVSPLTPHKHRGHNLYFPIPYADHCRITYENAAPAEPGQQGGDYLYYQINYRTYEPSTRVRSFRTDEMAALREMIGAVQARLRAGGAAPDGAKVGRLDLTDLAPGASARLEIAGPGAIRELRMALDAEDLDQALRSTVLEITFDGEPSVWCPLGDFFGTGHRMSPHRTWYTRITEDGEMACSWVMPFERDCVLRLHNVGDRPLRSLRCLARHGPWTWDERSMHFHATWRELNHVRTRSNEGATYGAYDVNFVSVDGRGVYVGDSLTMYNGAAVWWGEGDEKVFVDGEAFPSHIGTGTEDYYGYAWGNKNFFEAPFHAQAYGTGANAIDMVVNSRYRALDAIPFRSRIQFDMELWHWAECTVNYAPATFWYAAPGAVSNVEPDPATAGLAVVKDREQIAPVFRIPGVIEGEGLDYETDTAGVVEVQAGPTSWGWSGEQQLWWRDGRPGEVLEFNVPVERAGRYRAWANLTKAIDYGIVRITFEDQTGAGPIDRFNDGVASDELELGVFRLRSGANTMRVEIVGCNPEAEARFMFGLDYVRLESMD